MADEDLPVDDMYSTPVEMLPPDVPHPTRTFDPTAPEATDYSFDGVETSGNPLKSSDAFKRLRKRMPYSATMDRVFNSMTGDPSLTRPGQSIMAEVTRKILARIPEHLWTEDFLDTVDLRPMLAEVLISPAQVENADATDEINGVQWTQQERAYAAIMLQDQTKRIEDRVLKSLTQSLPEDIRKDRNHPAVLEAMANAAEVAGGWRRNPEARIPTPAAVGETFYDQASGEYKAVPGVGGADGTQSDTASILGLDTIGSEAITPTRFMSRDDITRLVRSGELSIDDLGAFESDPAELRGLVDGEVPRVSTTGAIQYENPTFQDRGPDTAFGPGGNMMGYNAPDEQDGRPGRLQKDWYTVRDILNKPSEMSREELLAVHEKLEKAGLYELVGGEPVIPGDSSDPAFKAAWKMLASMSLEKGESMVSILSDRTTAYQQELESALSVQLTDPARLRINGNVFARSAIGRELSPEEQSSLVEFLHDLERKNARLSAGLDINSGDSDPIDGVEELDEATLFDIDAQMEEWFDREHGGEVGARDIAETYDSFTRLLGGPGRGGNFG